jgi:hypothetical protein
MADEPAINAGNDADNRPLNARDTRLVGELCDDAIARTVGSES